jgi:hypothetical protein
LFFICFNTLPQHIQKNDRKNIPKSNKHGRHGKHKKQLSFREALLLTIIKDNTTYRYFFIFLKGVYAEDDVFVAENFNDLIGCIFLEKSLRDGNHREVSSFLNKTKFKMDENMRDMILEYLGDRIWIYDDLVVRNEPVVELINYIRNNY